MVTDADLLDQMRQANPVPDADDLHREPSEVAALWSSIAHGRASIMTDHTDVASVEASARRRWYQRPITALAIGALAVAAIAVPAILVSTDDGTDEGAPNAPTEEAAPAETPSGGASSATTSVAPDPDRVDAAEGLSFEWTRATLPGMPPDNTAKLTVAVFDGGLVATGGSNIWMSPDGAEWTRTATVEGDIRDIIAAGPGLVAVSAGEAAGNGSPRIWTSTTGVTWTEADLDLSVGQLRAIAARGTDLVAVGHNLMATSTDGVTWTGTSPRRQPEFEVGVWMHDVTVGGPGFVAVGGSQSGGWAAAWTSPDGVTWSRHSFGPTGGSWAMTEMKAITTGGPGFVAVGHGPLPGVDEPFPDTHDSVAWVWTSPDGITWTRSSHDHAVFGDAWMNDVTTYRNTLVAVGEARASETPWHSGPAVWASTDGITWQRLPHDDQFDVVDSGSMSSVVPFGDRLAVAVGDEVWIATPLPIEGETP